VFVARELHKTTRAVHAWESGEIVPSHETVMSLADVLRFPTEYFYRDDPPRGFGTPSFRSMSRLSQRERNAALGAASTGVEFAEWIEERYDLPPVSLPDLGGVSPETAAGALRAEWAVGQGPIGNLVHLLEAHGARVLSLARDCRDLDAFSFWRRDQPFVFLDTSKSAERSRWDAAHELGHLALHRSASGESKHREREADDFAAALLLPAQEIATVRHGSLGLEDLRRLKIAWGVSTVAYIRRIYEVDESVSEWTYRSLMVEASTAGLRRAEDEIPRETSQVLAVVLADARSDGITVKSIADALAIDEVDLAELLFGLAVATLPGESARSSGAPQPSLRLIEGDG
jgi:Zn-dependent peptidase ImmA (M78 family)/transcriptional regulator with XRE-family HTH domain